MTPEPFLDVIRVLPEPVILLAGTQRILAGNPPAARLLGTTPGELVGRSLHEFTADPPDRLADYLARCARSRDVVLGALYLRRSEGEVACRCEGALLVPPAAGEAPLIFLRLKPRESASSRFLLLNRKIDELAHEVHERMRAEQELRLIQSELESRVAARTEALSRANQELERSNQALQNFAAVASHDLREPLRKIVAFGDLLQEALQDRLDADSRHLLERMQAAAQRMNTFILNLLEYSRVTSRPDRFERVDLDAILRDVLADLDLRIQETGARIEAGDLPTIEADPEQMYQLMQNLVANALKFHRAGEPPRVHILSRPLAEPPAAAAGGTRYQIRFEDQGIGFDPAAAERIFDLFQRLHTRASYDGIGMGLAICKHIVERHGGVIQAEGRPGAGATFLVTLPERQASNGA